MPAVTPTYNLPYPVSSDPPDVPSDMKKLAEAIVLALDAMNGKLEFPIGTIIPLNPGAPIPTGWRLCNGTGGTPNLAGRTLIGVGAGPGGTYTAGQTGGAATVTLTAATSGIGIHQHVGSATVNIPAHTHTVPSSSVTTASATVSHNHSASSGSQNANHTHSGTTGGNSVGHTHSGSTGFMDRNQSHGHSMREGNAVSGDSDWWVDTTDGPQSQPDKIRGSLVMATDTNHAHAFTTAGQSANHVHAFTTGATRATTSTPSR